MGILQEAATKVMELAAIVAKLASRVAARGHPWHLAVQRRGPSKKQGIQGFASDFSAARTWYERAKEFGSAEAVRRLEILASRAH